MKKKEKTKKVKTKKEKNPGGKKRFSKKKLIILLVVMLAIAAAAVFFLRGKGDDIAGGEEEPVEEEIVREDPEVSAPISYTLDEGLEIMALPVGRGVVVKAHTPTVEEMIKLAEELAAQEKAEAAAQEEASSVEQLGASLDEEETEEGASEEAEGAEEEPAAEEEELEIPPIHTTYIYTGEGADTERLKLYCDLLMAEDFGFIAVDEEMVEIKKRPSFSDPSGSLHLVRAVRGKDYVEEVNLAEKGEDERMEYVPSETKELEGEFLASLRIEWDEEALRITPAMIEGAIVIPPPPEPMTLAEAVDHMYAMDPAVLGLEGESMEPYMVFPIDGSVMVEGVPAMRMYVYSKSESGTNVFEGQYLLTDGGHRVFVVQSDGTLREIEY